MTFYVGQVKKKWSKDWRTVVMNAELLDAAVSKTLALAINDETMARVFQASDERWDEIKVVFLKGDKDGRLDA